MRQKKASALALGIFVANFLLAQSFITLPTISRLPPSSLCGSLFSRRQFPGSKHLHYVPHYYGGREHHVRGVPSRSRSQSPSQPGPALQMQASMNGEGGKENREVLKRVHLLRHGQAMHNPRAEAAREADPPCSFDEFLRLMKEDDAFDAELTELGREQGKRAAALPLAAQVDASVQLVVSSPLSRALDTAKLVLPTATAKGKVAFVAHDDLRERSGWLLNAKRRPRAELAAKFPGCDFETNLPTEDDTLWTDELETEESTAERGYRFLCWLARRPEMDVAVVAHGGLFHYMLNSLRPRVVASDAASRRFVNTELRSMSMVWIGDGGGDDASSKPAEGENVHTVFKLDVL